MKEIYLDLEKVYLALSSRSASSFFSAIAAVIDGKKPSCFWIAWIIWWLQQSGICFLRDILILLYQSSTACHLNWVLRVLDHSLLHLLRQLLQVGRGGEAQSPVESAIHIRETIKYYVTDFFVATFFGNFLFKGWRGVPPNSAKLFWQKDFLLRRYGDGGLGDGKAEKIC